MTPSLREELILSHIPQVKLLARRLHRRCPQVELDDLISAGTIGLIQAVDRFDTKRNLKLKTLAEHRIRGGHARLLASHRPATEKCSSLPKTTRHCDHRVAGRWRGRQPCKDRSGARCFVTEVCNVFENNRGSGANLDSRADNRLGVDRLMPVHLGQRLNPWILVPALSLAVLASQFSS
jgi:RNA polymerase sigma factor (sigma-70 family)